MNESGGALSFATAVDTTGFEEGLRRIEEGAAGLGGSVEQAVAKIRGELENVPKVNLEIVSSNQSLDSIQAAFAEIDRVRELNEQGIRELEAEYKRFGEQAAAAYAKGTKAGNDEYVAAERQKKAVGQVINARKRAISEANEQCDALIKLEQEMRKEAEAASTSGQQHISLRTRLRELREELVEMEAAGMRGTEAYAALQKEAGELTDAWSDATAQASVLAHDQAGMQGIISGLSGVSGAFSAAQGAVGMFTGENEELNKVMLKVQSLMAITMGLQQVQQTLNKDSAFMLVTLNKLKEYWNKLMGTGAAVEGTATAATAANTAAQGANTVATVADTAAQTANNTSTMAGTAAQGANAVATTAVTAATTAATFSTKALTAAMKGLKYALVSTGIGALVVLLGELVSWIMQAFEATEKADEEFEEQQELLKSGREAYAKAKMEIEDYTSKINEFNGTQEDEKKLVEELNSKHGETMGYYGTLAEWKDVLKEKGEAYCETLLLEAQAQAVLNKYTEAYINLMATRDKVAAGEYDESWWEFWNWGGKSSEEKGNDAIKEAEEGVRKWEAEYKKLNAKIQDVRSGHGLGGHTQGGGVGGSVGGFAPTFDPKAAARLQKKAVDDWKEAVKGFLGGANDEIAKWAVEQSGKGLAQELNSVEYNTQKKKEAWEKQLADLAEIRKQSEKEIYMAGDGATEDGWEQTSAGKRTESGWVAILLEDQNLAAEYNRVMAAIEERGNKERAEIRQRYADETVEQFGTLEERVAMLIRKWTERINAVSPEYQGEAVRQMEADIARLESDNFKVRVDWDSMFENIGEQALPVLKYNLAKVREEFERNKDSMGTDQVKEYRDAIVKLETAISSRNPFSAFHKSIKELAGSKAEFSAAMRDWKSATDEVESAQNDYNAALEETGRLKRETGDGEALANSMERLREAKERMAKAEEKEQKAEQKTMTARNGITSGYKGFADALKNISPIVTELGSRAQALAGVFSSDVADGIGTAVETLGEIGEAASEVLSAVADVGKGVVGGVEKAVDAASVGMEGAAESSAAAMSAAEKATVVLAVISAALKAATAIVRLFNHDDSLQEEIESLQGRIDALQWELDNADTARLQERVADATERLRGIFSDVQKEVEHLHGINTAAMPIWRRLIAQNAIEGEVYGKAVERLADAWAAVDYTADKALGGDRFKESRKQLENLAQQQLLIQKQIADERKKKDVDDGKISDWQRQISELAQDMADIVNGALEDIIGGSSTDIASELGGAFIEAARQGEEAMAAWHSKVKEIVADVAKRMLISKFLEEPLGEVFDKYKKKWFGSDGSFRGINIVTESLGGFAADLDAVGGQFKQIWDELPESVSGWFDGDSEREGSQRGIATASQDSVDENNARLTTIQGHTYTIMQGVGEINQTGNAILERVSGIERNTAGANERLDRVNQWGRAIKEAVDDIALKGVKLKG